jgi:hypothetical protein
VADFENTKVEDFGLTNEEEICAVFILAWTGKNAFGSLMGLETSVIFVLRTKI